MKNKIFTYYWIIGLSLIFQSCTKENGGNGITSDAKIYKLASAISPRNYYMGGSVLSPQGNSPHGNFKLWLNNKAASKLDVTGELPIGDIFPDSSLIVKELGTPDVTQLAVMYKLKSTWYWAEYKPNGEVLISINAKGSSCISCHSQSGHRDNVVTYTLH